jgi:predicted AlkP superfamily pyrophosphatase or phosphodiesterase
MANYPHTNKANNATGKYVPEQDISISKHKVVYVIVDGLRYDCASLSLLLLLHGFSLLGLHSSPGGASLAHCSLL